MNHDQDVIMYQKVTLRLVYIQGMYFNLWNFRDVLGILLSTVRMCPRGHSVDTLFS